jgi:hypothetical protein
MARIAVQNVFSLKLLVNQHQLINASLNVKLMRSEFKAKDVLLQANALDLFPNKQEIALTNVFSS